MRRYYTFRSRRSRRAAAYIFALMIIAILGVFICTVFQTTNMGLQQACGMHNMLQSQLVAESGLEFMLKTLARVRLSGNTTQENFLTNLYTDLGRVMNGTPNLQGNVVAQTDQAVVTPTITMESGSFSAWLVWAGENRCRLYVKGTAEGISRTLSMDFTFVPRQPAVFDYGVASKGQVIISGSSRIVGVNYPTEANILSATESEENAISVDGNSVVISGDLYTSGDGTNVAISGSPSIGGARDENEVDQHIHIGIDAPDFPVVDTSSLEPLAVNIVDGNSDIGSKDTIENVRITAGTNPVFTNKVTVNGIVYVEAPNKVRFEGGATFNGFIVTEDNGSPLSECTLQFGGHVDVQGVEALPDTPEFHAVKEKTGTFVLAPGFDVTFSGSFSGVNGSIAADKLTFTGTAEGTVQGSVIGLKDLPTQIGGNVDIFVNRLDADPDPAGFIHSFALQADADSYAELRGDQ